MLVSVVVLVWVVTSSNRSISPSGMHACHEHKHAYKAYITQDRAIIARSSPTGPTNTDAVMGAFAQGCSRAPGEQFAKYTRAIWGKKGTDRPAHNTRANRTGQITAATNALLEQHGVTKINNSKMQGVNNETPLYYMSNCRIASWSPAQG